MSSVMVGMFSTRSSAESAKDSLLSSGFSAGAISITGNTTDGASNLDGLSGTTSTGESSHASGGIMHFFHTLFGGDDDSKEQHGGTYTEALRRGHYALTVSTTDDAKLDDAERILKESGAVDIDEQSRQWQSDGWTGAAVRDGSTAGVPAAAAGTGTLKEIEEQVKVGKRVVDRGGVRVFTRVNETPVEETVRLRDEQARIERRAVDRPATEADFAAFKEGSVEIRESSEVPVVSKTARVTGEVDIGKEVKERDEIVRDSVRSTSVEVQDTMNGDKRDIKTGH